MRLPTLTEMANGTAYFMWYSDGLLAYELQWTEAGQDPVFGPISILQVDIPISDAGGGYFMSEMKGLAILRWARKKVELITGALEEQE